MKRFYNSTDTCDRIKEDRKRCGKNIRLKAYKEKNEKGLWTGNWICGQCYNMLNRYGNTDIVCIKMANENNWYEAIERQYGKDFTDWAKKNRKIPDSWINAGCKTAYDYCNRCAIKAGYKDIREKNREWSHETGRTGIAIEINEDSESWFGNFVENYMVQKYHGAEKMPPGNIGFDWMWEGIKIDCKGRCLDYGQSFAFPIYHNNIADKFILTGWDNRESLAILIALEFDKNDLVRYKLGGGYILKKFWQREYITIPYTKKGLNEFQDNIIFYNKEVK